MAPHDDIIIRAASLSNVDSLSAIVPRAFHPVNPFCKQVFPDTPTVRAWWSQIFRDEISLPKDCHVIIALDTKTDVVVGVLTLRLFSPSDKTAGFWSTYKYTPDHDLEPFQPVINAAIRGRIATMKNTHFMIELFGVDHAFQGKGVGKRLLERAAEIIDEAGVEAFVESEKDARFVYQKVGFEVWEKVVFEEAGGKEDYLMVRKSAAERK